MSSGSLREVGSRPMGILIEPLICFESWIISGRTLIRQTSSPLSSFADNSAVDIFPHFVVDLTAWAGARVKKTAKIIAIIAKYGMRIEFASPSLKLMRCFAASRRKG